MQNKSNFPKVAYFCMEYGLDHELPIYAGGLGILAGDYLKAAHDLNMPLVAIGILWRQDYTEQFIGQDGRPYDSYQSFDFPQVKDTGVTVNVRVRSADVPLKVYMVDKYGNAPLYLLDASAYEEHSWMTNRLYGGVAQDRVAQEIILGIGGIRALRALGIDIDVYHFNEGHAVFAAFEMIREAMTEENLSFKEAWNKTKRQIIFTTHTPVEAGNEIHDHGLLSFMEANNGLSYEQLKEIGGDPFNMTVAALRLSQLANGVSQCHGVTARDMWRQHHDIAPIMAITNGIHRPTWQDSEIDHSFREHKSLWQPHQKAKERLFDYVAKHTNTQLDPNVLTIGFARRAAPYKRSDLIFRDPSLIEPLLRNKKLQLVFSGKAHPNDQFGKDIIARLVEMDKQYDQQVVFIENYNMDVARLMIQGCDIWLNNPQRPLEASGTSGMKAAMNGVLNLTVVDGWVAEGPQHQISGWLLDEVCKLWPHEQDEDIRDLRALHKVLQDDVIPTYYNDKRKWESMMRASIAMSHWKFSSNRMIEEYYDLMYNIVYNTLLQPDFTTAMGLEHQYQYQPTQ
ncbi:MAG: alpha-glucan family phosphorylase [Bacillota bacterium]|nr:alpha-glucan family phosphorylase [Bacillota bacterium]